MLSVLIRYRKSRREVVMPADSVEYAPPNRPRSSIEAGPFPPTDDHPRREETAGQSSSSDGLNRCCGGHGLLVFYKNEAQHLGITSDGDPDIRDVFVMNANGATVARYEL